MTASTTRTLNPLHFEDLEPHRFEDLIRQLVYDFRTWKSLEAIGRSGADEGIDILAVELVLSDGVAVEAGEEPQHRLAEERSWIIQCKRVQSIGPTKLREIVTESLPLGREFPHGFIIAAACDFSKQTRDAFREQMVERRIGEFYLWGKGELEDMLFLPKNDHLLFAYFGISIQVTRRSMKSQLSARLITKRRLLEVTRGLSGDPLQPPWLFLLDPTVERYPNHTAIADFDAFPRWGWFQFCGHRPPNNLCFTVRRNCGVFNPADGTWDALDSFDYQKRQRPPSMDSHLERDQEFDRARKAAEERWREATKDCIDRRCYIDRKRFIHYDRILAVDVDGDTANRGPHVLVDFDPANGPFDQRAVLRAVPTTVLGQETTLDPAKRTNFFQTIGSAAHSQAPAADGTATSSSQ